MTAAFDCHPAPWVRQSRPPFTMARRHVIRQTILTGLFAATGHSTRVPGLICLALLQCAFLCMASESDSSSSCGGLSPPMSFEIARSLVGNALYSASQPHVDSEPGHPFKTSMATSAPIGSMSYVHASDILSDEHGEEILQQTFGSARYRALGARRGARVGKYRGWQQPGPGRKTGSAMAMRESVDEVLLVLMCTMASKNLLRYFDASTMTTKAQVGLLKLRDAHLSLKDRSLRMRAWTLNRSGAMGWLLKLGQSKSRNDLCRQPAVAVYFSRNADGELACTCSGPERCIETGCMFQDAVRKALKQVQAASGMSTEKLFVVFESSVRKDQRVPGKATAFGSSLCTVWIRSGSWPFAVVRQSNAKNWMCLACPTADAECLHKSVAAAAMADRAAGTYVPWEPDDESPSRPFYPDDGDGESGALASNLYVLQSRFFEQHTSRLERNLVPPNVAQKERILLAKAATNCEVLTYTAPMVCPYCKVGPKPGKPPIPHACRIEFDDGFVSARVYSWRCSRCLLRVLPVGRECGLVFVSPFTAFSEAFLFETAVNLSRNGCSLRSTSYLRDAYTELSAVHKYVGPSLCLRSLTTLRRAVTLYLSLVIKGLPLAVSTCAKCVREDGSFEVICFEGLQPGYKVKYKKAFDRKHVLTTAIPRARLHAHLVTDAATSKALGAVFNASPVASVGSLKPITTIAGKRGYVMAIGALLGDISVDGAAQSYAGRQQHGLKASSAGRGWCPSVDGGVRPALQTFLGRFFRCGPLARALSLQIVAANGDLRRRVPPELMQRVTDLLRNDGPVQDDTGAAGLAALDALRRAAQEPERKAAAAKDQTGGDCVSKLDNLGLNAAATSAAAADVTSDC